MLNRINILKILKQFRQNTKSQFGIREIGIFGSIARDNPGINNDVDIVLKLDKQDLFNLIGIQQDLEEVLHSKVDVVSYRENMNTFLKKRIDEEAIYV